MGGVLLCDRDGASPHVDNITLQLCRFVHKHMESVLACYRVQPTGTAKYRSKL